MTSVTAPRRRYRALQRESFPNGRGIHQVGSRPKVLSAATMLGLGVAFCLYGALALVVSAGNACILL